MNEHVRLLAPTWLEYAAARAAVADVPVRHVGIGASNYRPEDQSPAIVCGLAGGLASNIEPGAVIIPDYIADEAGTLTACDAELLDALRSGCRRAGFRFTSGVMLTGSHIITGNERSHWADMGFMTADMETVNLARHVSRIATVRVALDTVAHPISSEWTQPRATLTPRLWRELLWLVTHAPQYALRAAVIVRYALRDLDP